MMVTQENPVKPSKTKLNSKLKEIERSRRRPADLVEGGPGRFELLLVEARRHHPAEAGHRFDAVEQRRVGAAVLVAVVVPRRDAVQAGVLVQQVRQLIKITANNNNNNNHNNKYQVVSTEDGQKNKYHHHHHIKNCHKNGRPAAPHRTASTARRRFRNAPLAERCRY